MGRRAAVWIHTQILVLKVAPGFPLGFDDIVPLFDQISDEHFLKTDQSAHQATSEFSYAAHGSDGDDKGRIVRTLRDVFIQGYDLFYSRH